MPKILLTADLHGYLPDIEPCDVLIVAGDVCPDHPIGKSERYGLPNNGSDFQLAWLDQDFRAWLKSIPAKQVIGIAGNHDFVFERMATAVRELHLPWTYLEDSMAVVGDLTIYGTPWVPGLPRWAFSADDRVMRMVLDAIPEGVDILVSHGPPYGIADLVGPRFGGPKRVGSVPLTPALDRIRPKAVVCGHIHEAYGEYRLPYDGGKLYSVSINDDYYRPVNRVVELEEFNDDPH